MATAVEPSPRELTRICEAMISENHMGYARRLADTGMWLWRHPAAPSSVPWRDDPPAVIRADEGIAVLLKILADLAGRRRLYWSLVGLPVSRRGSRYKCQVFAPPGPGVTPENAVISACEADLQNAAVALAIADLTGQSIHHWYRVLYPLRFLDIVDDTLRPCSA